MAYDSSEFDDSDALDEAMNKASEEHGFDRLTALRHVQQLMYLQSLNR